jgi:hypothetical protein
MLSALRADESILADGKGVWSRSPDAGVKFCETAMSAFGRHAAQGDGGNQSPVSGESAR